MANKTSYEDRAIKFIKTILAPTIKGCRNRESITMAIDKYNCAHTRTLKWASGYTRFAIIRNDYVVKVTHRHHSFAGDTATEVEGYEMAKKAGYDYLFAKPTIFKYKGRTYEIMPRINDINNQYKDWRKYLTMKEYNWVNDHFWDLAPRNLGYYRKKPVFVDYAFQA